jgi:hypothetical protein
MHAVHVGVSSLLGCSHLYMDFAISEMTRPQCGCRLLLSAECYFVVVFVLALGFLRYASFVDRLA